MVTGSCACGAVQYQIKQLHGPFIYCHCDDCKKTHSSAFSANAIAEIEDFAWTQGEDKLSTYKPFPDKTRCFCSVCGSHMIHKMDEDTEHIKIKMGTITAVDDFDPSKYDRFHIFCNYDTPWTDYEGASKYPQGKGK